MPAFLLISLSVGICGCTSVLQRTGIALFYKNANLPESQVRREVVYREGSTLPKHRLDLFLPAPTKTNWPVLIFIHGGGWTEGDKSLHAGGADVYGNIGRFYAAHNIGVAVINYRLQPGANWREQIDDAACTTAWIHSHIAEFGGDARRLFVSGHSAGAQLAARIALDSAPLKKYGLSPAIFSGVISVSGAGLDLADEKTYELGASRKYYSDRFDNTNDWKKIASPVNFAKAGAPPFLILYAGGEKKPLQRQSQRLSEVLSQQGISNQVVVVPGQSHARMVLTLSRPDKISAPAVLEFIENQIKK
ncbi:MAG: alpha/beta hydrolase [Verrucomicrobiota bacterium]